MMDKKMYYEVYKVMENKDKEVAVFPSFEEAKYFANAWTEKLFADLKAKGASAWMETSDDGVLTIWVSPFSEEPYCWEYEYQIGFFVKSELKEIPPEEYIGL